MVNLLTIASEGANLIGFPGNAGWDVVKWIFQKATYKNWNDLIKTAFRDAYNELAREGTQIEVNIDDLLAYEIPIELDDLTLSGLTSDEFAVYLTNAFNAQIGYEQLEDPELQAYVQRFIERLRVNLKKSFIKQLSTNQDAFRKAVMEELLIHQELISDVLKIIPSEFDYLMTHIDESLDALTSDYYEINRQIKTTPVLTDEEQPDYSFYEGTEPNWSDIRANFDARRDKEQDILNFIKANQNPTGRPPFALILGRSGDGKSTLLMRLATTLVEQDYAVYWHKDSSENFSGHLFNSFIGINKRIVVCIDNFHRFQEDQIEALLRDLNRNSSPVTILATARSNIWFGMQPAVNSISNFEPFELGDLSNREINAILDKLKAADALGELKGFTRDEQIEYINESSQNQLLVTLLEAKYNESLIDIVRRHIREIERRFGKKVAYACYLVSAAHTFELEFPQAGLEHSLGLQRSLNSEVLSKTRGFLISPESGRFGLKTRHSVVASVLFEIDPDREESLSLVIDYTANSYGDKHLAVLDRIRQSYLSVLDPAYVVNIFNRRTYDSETQRKLITKLAYFCRDTEQYERATEFFKEAITINRKTQNLCTDWAQMEASIGNYDNARIAYGKLLDIDRKSARVWVAWARMEQEAGDFERAVDLFQEGVKEVPGWGDLYLYRAKLELERGNYRQAIVAYQQGAERNPTYERIWRDWARLERQSGNYEQADSIYERGTTHNPHSSELWELWAQMQQERGHYEKAQQIYQTGTEKNVENPDLWKKWGNMERLRGNYDRAQQIYRTGTEHNPTNSELWIQWGNMEKDRGHYEQSDMVFKTGVEHNPDASNLRKEWGTMKWSCGDFDGAEHIFRDAIERDLTKTEIWKEWGNMEQERGDFLKAETIYRQGTQVNTRSNHELWIQWGNMERERGNFDQARLIYRKGTEYNPNNSAIWKEWGNMERECQNYYQAEAIYREGSDNNLTSPELWKEWAFMERKRGNYRRAGEIYKQGTDQVPTSSELWRNWGQMLWEQGNYQLASEIFEQGTQENSKSAILWILWGNMEQERGYYEQARSIFQNGLEHSPRNPEIWKELGNLEQQQGHYEKAKACYEKGIEHNPQNGSLWVSLGNMERELGHYDAAISIYQKGIEIGDTKNSNLWVNWSLLEQERGNLEEAEKLLQTGSEYSSQSSLLWLEWGLLKHKSGDYEQAEAYYRKATELNSTIGRYWQLWGELEQERGNLEEAQRLFQQATESTNTPDDSEMFDDMDLDE